MSARLVAAAPRRLRLALLEGLDRVAVDVVAGADVIVPGWIECLPLPGKYHFVAWYISWPLQLPRL